MKKCIEKSYQQIQVDICIGIHQEQLDMMLHSDKVRMHNGRLYADTIDQYSQARKCTWSRQQDLRIDRRFRKVN